MDRQRILILFGVAWLSAAALTWFLYSKTKAPQQERKVQVVVAARDLPIGSLLKKGDVKRVALPEINIPRGAAFEERDALGRVVLYPISASELVLASKLSAVTSTEGVASTIEPGFRAVSVQITDVSGVAGLVLPNSRVDVLFTRPGNMAEATTSTILQNVKVLSVGRLVPTGQTADARAPRSPVATLVLRPEDAQKLELAKNQGKISLSLRNSLDASQATNPGPMTTEALDPMISARMARARRGRTTNVTGANLDDPKVWQELTGDKKVEDDKGAEEARRRKEAEKPRAVVDVYRGDKHVQELFR